LHFVAFDTESRYDKLEVEGTYLSGDMDDVAAFEGTTLTQPISWNADYSVESTGWKICNVHPGETTTTTTEYVPYEVNHCSQSSEEIDERGIKYQTIVYGKYYSKKTETGACDATGNSFTVFRKSDVQTQQPTLIHIHGGGFLKGNRWDKPNFGINVLVKNGYTVISIDYRLVGHLYYYQTQMGAEQEEEFINASPLGELTIPQPPTKLTDYKVKMGRQEFVTKCVYDATKAMDYIIEHAAALNVDLNSISTMSDSAGGAEAHYLTWTYPLLKPGLYTVRSMVHTRAQVDYCVQNSIRKVYLAFTEELGPEALVSDYVDAADCGTVIGNPQCEGTYETDLCNTNWQEKTMAKFCGSNFSQITFGQLDSSQMWIPENDHERGLDYLWDITESMRRFAQSGMPKPRLWIKNHEGKAGEKGWSAWAHHAVFAHKVFKLCNELDLFCAAHWGAWHAIKSESKGLMVVDDLEYGETMAWRTEYQTTYEPQRIPETTAWLLAAVA